jgi:ABC-type multidrug transport system fused ATPase/permease subunit
MRLYSKIFNLFDNKNINGFIYLIFLSIIAIIFETIGIAAVIPLVSAIIKPTYLIQNENSKFIEFIPDFLLDFEQDYLVLFFLSIFGGIFFLKNIYLIIYNYFISSYSNKLKAQLTNSLLNRYLNQNYLFHVNKKYSNILANLTTETSFLVNGILVPSIVMMSEILLLTMIAILIFFLELYKVLIIFGVFFIVGILLIKIIKKFTTKWGTLREQEEKIRIESLNKLITGIRDIILIGRKENLLDKFSFSESNIAKYNIKNATLMYAPKYIFETLGILGLILSVIFLKLNGSSTFEVLTAASFFIATSYRAIPSINKILNSYQTIKYYFPVVNVLDEELKLQSKVIFSNKKLNFKNQFRLINGYFKYPNTEIDILNDINLTVTKGKIIAIIGETGSGKSTLIDIISGLINFDKGQMIVDENIINNSEKIRFWQNNVSYVSQNTYLMDDSIKKNIAFGLNPEEIDQDLLNDSIKISQLEYFINSLPKKTETFVGERGVSLSGGQIQRIGIARAIYRNSDFLILDEITSSLDKDTEKKIIENIIKQKGDQTILIVTHNTNLLRYCDDAYIIKDKKIKKIDKTNYY